jgi:methylthioribose-1-phosphate isomerase
MAVEPIRWRGDRLELLDQRLLPGESAYVTCRSDWMRCGLRSGVVQRLY